MAASHGTPDLPAPGSLAVLGVASLVAGAVVGGVGALFRLALARADQLRDQLVALAHGHALPGLLLVVASCAATAGLAAWLVRRYAPTAAGSGIPQVEAALAGRLPAPTLGLIPVKFLGGLLAIGGGLALGREGPTVQMGAAIARGIGQLFRRHTPDCHALMAAGAGAGLATAFNSPIAGAVFVLEELVRRFEVRTAIAALGASATAIGLARVFLGDLPDFHVGPLAYAPAAVRPLFFLLGAVAGLLAVAYNRTVLGCLQVADRLGAWPAPARAAGVGAAVGGLAWFLPGTVGGGDPLTQLTLDGGLALAGLPLFFLLRFGLGAVSYAAGTPGGLFAPLLVLGAQLGFFFGGASHLLLPGVQIDPTTFAVVGMAAFFTGVVRAPITGIALVIEMTGSFSALLPMLGAAFLAMLVPTLLGSAPLYDALRERALRTAPGPDRG